MLGLIRSSVDPKSQRIFDNGNYTHERYVDYFRRVGKLHATEVKKIFTFKDITISGKLDVILKDYSDELHIGELKTINDRNFTELLISNSPKKDHFLQWNLYAYGFEIHDGFILYENKNDQRLQIFPVTFDEEIFNQTMNKFSYIQDCTRQGKLVPVPDDADCRWCSAANYCKKNISDKEVNDAITTIMVEKLK